MSIHEIALKSGKTYEVRWRSFDDLAQQQARRFRRKKDAERFERRIKDIKTKQREDGYVTIPAAFEADHPLAFEWLTGSLSDVLEQIYPDHVFTITTPAEDGRHELPLNGSIEWTAQRRKDAERELAEMNERWAELGRRHPEIVDAEGEIDFALEDTIKAAIAVEPDLFPGR